VNLEASVSNIVQSIPLVIWPTDDSQPSMQPVQVCRQSCRKLSLCL